VTASDALEPAEDKRFRQTIKLRRVERELCWLQSLELLSRTVIAMKFSQLHATQILWEFLLPPIHLFRHFRCKIYRLATMHSGRTTSQSYGVSLGVWDHTVLSPTRHKWTHPP